MIKFNSTCKIHFNWSENLTKKFYDYMQDQEERDCEIYLRVDENTYVKVYIVSARAVEVIDEGYLSGCKIQLTKRQRLYGEIVADSNDYVVTP